MKPDSDQKGLRADAEKAIQATRWIPDWGQARIEGMVELQGAAADEARRWYEDMDAAREAWLAQNGQDEHSPERRNFARQYREQNPFPYADMDDVMAHFTHVIDLVGIEHVGIGSDFDGVGDSLPEGMKDVSFYPNLVERFLRLEYSPADIQKVMSGNLMRVWRQAEAYAAQAAAGD